MVRFALDVTLSAQIAQVVLPQSAQAVMLLTIMTQPLAMIRRAQEASTLTRRPFLAKDATLVVQHAQEGLALNAQPAMLPTSLQGHHARPVTLTAQAVQDQTLMSALGASLDLTTMTQQHVT